MIVDCHTHIWQTPHQLGEDGAEYVRRHGGRANASADPVAHLSASECVDKCLVLAFTSRYLGAEVPNALVAEYVDKHPEKMIGIAGVDPLADDVEDRLAEAAERKAFRGVTISPASQDFHPAHSRVRRLYDYCSRKKLAIVVHQDPHFSPRAKMEYARPYLWDEVLRDFPDLAVVIVHLGHPWVDETLALLSKHRNLYADISGLIRRPWNAYNALVTAHQYAVTDKLLFGSDFPFMPASEAIECVYRLNEVTHGAPLPVVPREALRGIVERDALTALGIRGPGDPQSPAT